jgi:cyclopropane-fatty-acyl-phospholipid synthase
VGKAKLREYFESAWRGLKPGGLFLNHGITASGREMGPKGLLDQHLFRKGAFIRKYVFPDGELLPVWENVDPAERAGFEVRDVESWREHYAATLSHWVRRLEAHREEAVGIVGERVYRLWRLYMAGCAHAFATGRLNLHQVLLSRPDGAGRSYLPRTRADLYLR